MGVGIEEQWRRLSKQELIGALEDRQRKVADNERLLHELQVHQMELELQNRELRETHERLDELVNRYADLYDFAPIAYLTLNERGIIIEINLTGAKLLGCDRAHLLGKPFIQFARMSDSHSFWRHLRRCLDLRAPIADEFEIGAMGERISLHAVSAPVFDGPDRVSGIRMALTDVSRFKAAEIERERAHRAEASMRQRFEALDQTNFAISNALLNLDARGTDGLDEAILEQARSLLRADVAAIGFPDPETGVYKKWIQRGLDMGEAAFARLVTPHGPLGVALRSTPSLRFVMGDAPIECFASAEVRFGSETRAVLAVANKRHGEFDADDMQALELIASRAGLAFENARLFFENKQAVHSRDELLAIVAHDLGNPLNAILLCTARLAPTKVENDRRRTGKQVEIIRRAAVRMNRLVDDLHTVAAIESGRFAVELHPVRLKKLVDAALLELEPVVDARAIELASRCAYDAVVLCDRERIIQIFGNLIGNAVKFTASGGRIVLSAEVVGNEVLFEVSDTGAGIDENQLPLVFDRHWRGSTARRGRGLGLYIVKGIVEAHGGRVWVESKLGAGTSFYFTIPLAESGTEPVTAP